MRKIGRVKITGRGRDELAGRADGKNDVRDVVESENHQVSEIEVDTSEESANTVMYEVGRTGCSNTPKLKGAPVPISRHATRQSAPLPVPLPPSFLDVSPRLPTFSRSFGICARSHPSGVPRAVAIPTMLARARARAIGVKLGTVVQRDGVHRMGGTKNMTAVPTMMPALEQ